METTDTSESGILALVSNPNVLTQLRNRLEDLQETVTTGIGEVARISGLSIQQLRYMERTHHIPQPERVSYNEATNHPGQRRYSLTELATLVVMSELVRQTSYSLQEIAGFFGGSSGWRELVNKLILPTAEVVEARPLLVSGPINAMSAAQDAQQAVFWRFLVPRAMYLATCLLFGRGFGGEAGLFVPLDPILGDVSGAELPTVEHLLARLRGHTTLAGWHGRGQPFRAFRTQDPTLEHSDRYRVVRIPLPPDSSGERTAYIVVEEQLAKRVAEQTPHKIDACSTAAKILSLLRETQDSWGQYMLPNSNYMPYDANDMADADTGERLDDIMSDMANLIVKLGGANAEDYDRPLWRFCCILVPDSASLVLPLQERILVVRGRNDHAPHPRGMEVTPNFPSYQRALTLEAYWSGQISYLPDAAGDPYVYMSGKEKPVGSAIAIPIEGDEGHSTAVMYLVSSRPHAFPPDMQRALRIFGRMVGDLIATYEMRHVLSQRLDKIIEAPQIVDVFFEDFPSQNEFRSELDAELAVLSQKESAFADYGADKTPLEYLALIGVDMDGARRVALRYGDLAARNIMKEIGRQIQRYIDFDLSNRGDVRLYRMYADRFYIVLRNKDRGEVEEFARKLRINLANRPFQFHTWYAIPSEAKFFAPGLATEVVSVRLSVATYSTSVLRRMLAITRKNYLAAGRTPDSADVQGVYRVRAQLTNILDEGLLRGKHMGGGMVLVLVSDQDDIPDWRPDLFDEPALEQRFDVEESTTHEWSDSDELGTLP